MDRRAFLGTLASALGLLATPPAVPGQEVKEATIGLLTERALSPRTPMRCGGV